MQTTKQTTGERAILSERWRLAALELSRGSLDGACLVWGAADRGARAAALLSR